MMKKIKISGFTFIKNGLTLGYPIKESIESVADFCDEIIINIGFDDPNLINDDGTYKYLTDHFKSDKFIFLKSFWDPSLTKDGLILSEQTNIALKKCQGKYCQYIQADEIIHQDDINHILESVNKMNLNDQIDGVVYNYIHFYGNVDTYKYTRTIYRREVRLIRNHIGIKSWLDAQGFKTKDNKKLNCILSKQRIFHYGWARLEQIMKKKVTEMDKLYDQGENRDSNFKYQRLWGMKKFTNTHPKYMSQWIKAHKNNIDLSSLKLTYSSDIIGLMISDFIEELTGYRIGEYKNYKLI